MGMRPHHRRLLHHPVADAADGIYAVRLTVNGQLPAGRTNEVYTSAEVGCSPARRTSCGR